MTDSLGFMDLKKRVGNNAEIYDAPHKRNVRFRGIVSINDNGIYCVGLFPLKDYDIIHFTEDPPEKSYFITGLFKPKTQMVTYMLLMDDYRGDKAYCSGTYGTISFDSQFQPLLETKNKEFVMLQEGDIISTYGKYVLLSKDDRKTEAQLALAEEAEDF